VLHARPVEGTFRRLRWAASAVLIAVLVGIPWIRIGGVPLVLLDVRGPGARRASVVKSEPLHLSIFDARRHPL